MGAVRGKAKDPAKIVEQGKKGWRRLIFGRTLIILLALVAQIGILLAFMLSLMEWVPALLGGTVVFTAVMLGYILNTRENPSVKLS